MQAILHQALRVQKKSFEKCLYLPIGPQCRLLGLDQLGFRFDEEVSEEGSLAVYVRIQVSMYESLRYHKYLIVLDDIWNTEIVIREVALF